LQVNAVLASATCWETCARHAAGQTGHHLASSFDKSELTFRNKLYPDYKAHRPPRRTI